LLVIQRGQDRRIAATLELGLTATVAAPA